MFWLEGKGRWILFGIQCTTKPDAPNLHAISARGQGSQHVKQLEVNTSLPTKPRRTTRGKYLSWSLLTQKGKTAQPRNKSVFSPAIHRPSCPVSEPRTPSMSTCAQMYVLATVGNRLFQSLRPMYSEPLLTPTLI